MFPENCEEMGSVVTYYPPLVDVGCKRSVAFSKYFKKHGWNPFGKVYFWRQTYTVGNTGCPFYL